METINPGWQVDDTGSLKAIKGKLIFKLDGFEAIDVSLGDETLSLTPRQIFELVRRAATIEGMQEKAAST